MIRRAPRPARYTVVDNATVEDPQLSFKALGLLVYLLSKPDHWRVDRDQLASTHQDGVTSVRSALRELAAAGYLRTEPARDRQGRMAGKEAVIYDRPVTTDGADRPVGNQPVVHRPAENAPLRVTTEVATTDQLPTTSATPADAAAAQLPLVGVGPQAGDSPGDIEDPMALPWQLVRDTYAARARKPIESRKATARTVRRLLDAGWTEAQVRAALMDSPAWTPTSLQVELARGGARPGRAPGRAQPLADDPRRQGESRVVDIAEEMRRARR